MRLDLPPRVIGQDYLGPTRFIARAPRDAGWQFPMLGLAGVTLAHDEGLELNLLGVGFGVDVDDMALRLPGLVQLPGPL